MRERLEDDRTRCGRMLKLIQAPFVIERQSKALREGPNAHLGDVEYLVWARAEAQAVMSSLNAPDGSGRRADHVG